MTKPVKRWIVKVGPKHEPGGEVFAATDAAALAVARAMHGRDDVTVREAVFDFAEILSSFGGKY